MRDQARTKIDDLLIAQAMRYYSAALKKDRHAARARFRLEALRLKMVRSRKARPSPRGPKIALFGPFCAMLTRVLPLY